MTDKITAEDLAEKKGDFVLIDMWEAEEIAEDGGATIEGAVNIPLGQLIRKARQGGLEDLKGKIVCTYCNGGYRNIGADELNKKGFIAVTIDGGYAAWKEEEKKKKELA